MYKTLLFTVFLLSFGISISLAQTKIYGVVQGKNGEALAFANILLKASSGEQIIGYAVADKEANFSIETKHIGEFSLFISFVGYQDKELPFTIEEGTLEVEIHPILKEDAFKLEEVFIQAELPIIEQGDTISFKTKFFADGTEQNLEDLLKKIPGLNVDESGTIKIGNQEIESLMIDGDDMFEKGYKVLSKNMPAYPIEEIELLNKFTENSLLKGIEESDKVALNLKLNEDSKNVWFGNLNLGTGEDFKYDFRANVMNFGSKAKYYFISNNNNIGYDATGDIQNLINPYSSGNTASIGDNEKLEGLLSLSAPNLDFSHNRTKANQAKMQALNSLFKPTENLRIKILGFLNQDAIKFHRKTQDFVHTGNTNFTNTEDYHLQNKKQLAFGKFNIDYNLSENKLLESETKFNYAKYRDRADFNFNELESIENLAHQNKFIDQKLSFTNRLKDGEAFLLTGRFMNEQTPKTYRTDKFTAFDLFPNSENVNKQLQNSQNKMLFWGINAQWMKRKSKEDLLSFQIGNTYRKDFLNSEFSLLNDDLLIDQPEAYQNNLDYQVNDLYFKSQYRYEAGKMSFIGNLNFHQLFNSIKQEGKDSKQHPFYIQPSIGVDWKINNRNKIISSYSYTTNNSKATDIFSNYFLTGHRSFNKGTGDFNQLNASSFFVNYQLGNWTDRLFINSTFIYNKQHDYFANNLMLNPNYEVSEKFLVKNQEIINIQSNADYYLKAISSNVKLKFGYTKSNFKNIVNHEIRNIQSSSHNYGVEYRSMFPGFFNVHLGANWTKHRIKSDFSNTYSSLISFADFNLLLSSKLDIKLQAENYYFNELESNKSYYFLDFSLGYQLIENKLKLYLTGKNLLNTKSFRTLNHSEIGTSTTAYKLLPRMSMLSLEYRF